MRKLSHVYIYIHTYIHTRACMYIHFREEMLHFCIPTLSCIQRHWKTWWCVPAPLAAGANGDAPCVGLPARFCSCWSGQLLQRQQTKHFNVVCLVWPGGSSFLCWDPTMEPWVILAFPHRGSGAPAPRGPFKVLLAVSAWRMACTLRTQPLASQCKNCFSICLLFLFYLHVYCFSISLLSISPYFVLRS